MNIIELANILLMQQTVLIPICEVQNETNDQPNSKTQPLMEMNLCHQIQTRKNSKYGDNGQTSNKTIYRHDCKHQEENKVWNGFYIHERIYEIIEPLLLKYHQPTHRDEEEPRYNPFSIYVWNLKFTR